MEYTQRQNGLIVTSNNTGIEISSGQDITHYGSRSETERMTLTPVEASMALSLLDDIGDDNKVLGKPSLRLGDVVVYLSQSPNSNIFLFRSDIPDDDYRGEPWKDQARKVKGIKFSAHNSKPLTMMLTNALETLTQRMNPGYSDLRIGCVHCDATFVMQIDTAIITGLFGDAEGKVRSVQGCCPECGEEVARLIVSAW